MSKVLLTEVAELELIKDLQLFTEDDKISLRYWINFVEEYGIWEAQKNIHFRDHALSRNWEGCRSACFGYSARIIYRVKFEDIEIVEIVKITIKHDYTRNEK